LPAPSNGQARIRVSISRKSPTGHSCRRLASSASCCRRTAQATRWCAEAFAELIGKLRREGIFREDMHLGNVFFQNVKRHDGSDYWRAGISDTDRIDLFGQPRAGREPNGWMREFEEYPHEQNLKSRQPGEFLRDSEDAVLASLEHKGHLKWDPVARCFGRPSSRSTS
jgi:hypothetical protein